MNVSEAYISQLMSGVKKLNMEFIKNFEKSFDVEMKITIISDDQKYTTVEWVKSDAVKLGTRSFGRTEIGAYSFENHSDNVTVSSEENDSFLIAR